MKILTVCLGNICRSPTAEAALNEALREAGLDHQVSVDSAGTGDWHLGEPPDERMTRAATKVGLTLSGRSRQITRADFAEFDLILVMDQANYADVTAMAPDGAGRDRVRLFRSFDPDADHKEVPDPYYGGETGFHAVVELCRAAARGVLAEIQQTLDA